MEFRSSNVMNLPKFQLRVASLLESLNVLPISEVIVVRLDFVLNKYIFVDVYKVFSNYSLETLVFGSAEISNSTDLLVTHNKLLRTNLRGVQLRCALVV